MVLLNMEKINEDDRAVTCYVRRGTESHEGCWGSLSERIARHIKHNVPL